MCKKVSWCVATFLSFPLFFSSFLCPRRGEKCQYVTVTYMILTFARGGALTAGISVRNRSEWKINRMITTLVLPSPLALWVMHWTNVCLVKKFCIWYGDIYLNVSSPMLPVVCWLWKRMMCVLQDTVGWCGPPHNQSVPTSLGQTILMEW